MGANTSMTTVTPAMSHGEPNEERCTGCGVCLKHCPQMIAIPEEMARLGKFVENLRTRQG